MFTRQELEGARELVRAAMPATPAYRWPLLCQRLGSEVVVKHENHTPTGAFKVRGGLTYVDGLLRTNPGTSGVIAATRGNHGQSIAFAAQRRGLAAVMVVPHGNSVEKNAAMRAFGAEVVEHGHDFHQAFEKAQALAAERGLQMVPSYHRDLVRGVATYALELLVEQPHLDRLYVPIGLGSGICGCIVARDALGLKTEIVGVQSDLAPSYALSFRERRAVSTEDCDTFADGIATRTPHPDALDVILGGAADVVTVSDGEIAGAVRHYWTDTHNLAEGAGAAALAAAFKERGRNRGRRVGVVLSGGNIDLALFRRLIAEADDAA